MNEFVQVAQKVVKAVSRILTFPVSLSDEHGYIIGSTDESRIGTFHKPSKEVLEKDDFMMFNEDEVVELPNVFAGVAVPLKFENQTVGILGIIGTPREVRPHAQLIKKYVEMTWQDTFRKQLINLERETIEAFLQYILLNEIIDEQKIKQYCDMLKINDKMAYFCIIIDIGDSLMNVYERSPVTSNRSKEELLRSIEQAFNKDEKDICAFLNLEKIVLLKAIESEEMYVENMERFTERGQSLLTILETYQMYGVVVASGGASDSLHHVHTSYYEAEYLIDYGKEQKGSRPIYSYFDWHVLLDLLPKSIDHRLRAKVYERLKPLREEDDFSDLKRDFLTYCEQNMIISKAAEKLFIHRNTLIYRLDKLEKRTSLDVRNFEHCTLLYMTLKTMN